MKKTQRQSRVRRIERRSPHIQKKEVTNSKCGQIRTNNTHKKTSYHAYKPTSTEKGVEQRIEH